MTLNEAIALCEKASHDAAKLTFDEGMKINAACAIVAMEYIRVRQSDSPLSFRDRPQAPVFIHINGGRDASRI